MQTPELHDFYLDGNTLGICLKLPLAVAIENTNIELQLTLPPKPGTTSTPEIHLYQKNATTYPQPNNTYKLEWPWSNTSDGLIRSVKIIASGLQNPDIEIPPSISQQLKNLYAETAEEFMNGFAARAYRPAGIETQIYIATELFNANKLGPKVHMLLAMILIYKRLEILPSSMSSWVTAGLEDAFNCLASPVAEENGKVSTLELQRQATLYNLLLWQGQSKNAEKLLESSVIDLEQTADPMVATEYLLRARLLLACLALLNDDYKKPEILLNQTHALLQQCMALADPMRLNDYIRLRKSYQLTSIAGGLLRQLQQNTPLQTILPKPIKAGINLGKRGCDTIMLQLGFNIDSQST